MHSNTCGAAIDAYKQVKNKKGHQQSTPTGNYLDYQAETIKKLLAPHASEVASEENEMVALAYKMYEIQLQFLNDIINLNF